ncbi:hypothetical protein RD110_08215 [Rhodoferax koreense]|uniref:NodB homology domain-containing protein n=1 Tax=Rhodoferax koreensis TaxID=1842727 RepID=A0A1P8JTV3_9BURK|nr:hypothetical protein [Rhodoferax koreense]APW37184.1 hypothetical protein RD110_08215 [Rhodoferax koreense]
MTTAPSARYLWWRRLGVIALAAVLLSLLWHWSRASDATPVQVTRLALLIPDDLSDDNVHVKLWQDAAAENGFAMSVVRASALLRPGGLPLDAALILPDTVHRRMNDALVAQLEQRVRNGGQILLTQDAGLEDMDGTYHPVQSRFSDMAGVRYALYGELGARMSGEQVAWVDGAAMPLLRLSPGKLMREDSQDPLTSTQPPPLADEELAVVSYNYGRLRYPVFQTRGRFDGRRLMHFDGDGLLAGLHAFGKGQVLFVNLPLGYLKLRTDGFFLNSFLRYFAQDVARLPQLSPMPDARGAMVMNWHIDSAAAVPAMESLTALGVFEQGPYSVHLTAGPDVDAEGDGQGMDLANNTRMKEWVRRFADRGDEVGSHGGWIHNAFGRLVDRQDRKLSIPLIEKNLAAVAQASGRSVREYSAPIGNHPAWVTRWLRGRGIHAYYFTGDIGMAPTRSYQDGLRGPEDMWSFPVMSYGVYASFEEAQAAHVPERDIEAWLKDVADFCAEYRTVRLVYFHPPGIAMFPEAFKGWMRHTAELVKNQTLRWTTMAAYADFANDRLKVDWTLEPDGAQDGGQWLEASHPRSLEHMTWLLPVDRYARPTLLAGQAQIDRDVAYWRVVAGASPTLRLRLAPATGSAASTSPSTPHPDP